MKLKYMKKKIKNKLLLQIILFFKEDVFYISIKKTFYFSIY